MSSSHERKKHMKILLSTTALALTLGISTISMATPYIPHDVVIPSITEAMPSIVLDEAADFYQGDFLTGTRASLVQLTPEDMYSGRGATESSVQRWVT